MNREPDQCDEGGDGPNSINVESLLMATVKDKAEAEAATKGAEKYKEQISKMVAEEKKRVRSSGGQDTEMAKFTARAVIHSGTL